MLHGEDTPMTEEKDSGAAWLATVIIFVVLPLLYIGFGQFMGRVNNTALVISTPAGASHVIDVASRMIARDLQNGFCPSSYIWPGHIRYDVCGFQEGEQQIWQRLAMQLNDHLTREGAASDRDVDLNIVLANLNRPNTWSLLFSSNNTASLLGSAFKHLDAYNAKLAAGKAGYFPRIDNLASLVSDLTSILGSESKQLTEKAAASGLYSMQARGAYFHTLGTLAASCQILQAARVDFADVLKAQSAEAIYDQAMHKTCEKMDKNPAVVINADDLSHLLTLSGSAAAAVNDLSSLQTALAAGSRGGH